MDIYKTPEADVEIETGRKFKPIKAIILGLLVSVVLSTIVSMVEVIVGAMIFGVNLHNQESINAMLNTNTKFQIIDTAITLLVMFFAGSVVGKYAVGKEILFGLIVASITFGIALYIAIHSGGLSTGPEWYNVTSFLIIFIGIYFGSRRGKKF